MAVKIRLKRRGRKKLALFDVVVTDARTKRDGAYIEKIGTYNPQTNPASIRLNQESALNWLLQGAQPTDTVRAMLAQQGILLKKHLQVGVRKGAITQAQADEKFRTWHQAQQARIQDRTKYLLDTKQQQQQQRLAQETIVKEQRLAQQQKQQQELQEQKQQEELSQASDNKETTETAEESDNNETTQETNTPETTPETTN